MIKKKSIYLNILEDFTELWYGLERKKKYTEMIMFSVFVKVLCKEVADYTFFVCLLWENVWWIEFFFLVFI